MARGTWDSLGVGLEPCHRKPGPRGVVQELLELVGGGPEGEAEATPGKSE